MTRLLRILRRLAIFAFVIALIYSLYDPVWNAAKWVAWNWVRVDFVATCRVFEFDQDHRANDFEFLKGPYSGEFLREVVAQWDETYPDIELRIEADGALTVPLGFYLPVDPFWSRFDGQPEVEGRGYSISVSMADRILQRRLSEGVDVTPYKHYQEWIAAWQSKDDLPRLYASVCGFMDALVLKDGALARP